MPAVRLPEPGTRQTLSLISRGMLWGPCPQVGSCWGGGGQWRCTAVGARGKVGPGVHSSRKSINAEEGGGQLHPGGVCKPGVRKIDACRRQREQARVGPQASSFSPACGRVPSICRADLVLASLTTPLSILHGAVRIVQPCHSLALNCCVLEHSRVWEGDLVHAPHIREHPSRV